jgi:hypothetical protein
MPFFAGIRITLKKLAYMWVHGYTRAHPYPHHLQPTHPGDPTSPRLQRRPILYLGRIDDAVNFVHGPRARGEVVTFDVVSNPYKYNVIFGR